MHQPEQKVVVAGIDVGSAGVKMVLLESSPEAPGRILFGESERIRRRNPQQVATDLFAKGLNQTGLNRSDLAYVATTGEGENIPFRTGHFYGMTTHARGGLYLNPEVRTIIDVGALHTRAVRFDERAKVESYRMTSQCASGSGQFLENICRYLGITIHQIGPLSLESEAPEACSSICAVLAETDVINMVSRGISASNIIKGIHLSMAGRYIKLLTASGSRGRVLVTGGLAFDVGLLAAMNEAAEEANAAFRVEAHPRSILAGSIGAAIWGAYRWRKLTARGIDLSGKAAA